MSLEKDTKEKIIKKFQRVKNDTGSAEVQVALLSERIKDLSDHLKQHKKDAHSRRGLLQLVNKRRKLLNYLKTKQAGAYEGLVKKLDIKG
jgi:small subunit ribosomal protein S15